MGPHGGREGGGLSSFIASLLYSLEIHHNRNKTATFCRLGSHHYFTITLNERDVKLKPKSFTFLLDDLLAGNIAVTVINDSRI